MFNENLKINVCIDYLSGTVANGLDSFNNLKHDKLYNAILDELDIFKNIIGTTDNEFSSDGYRKERIIGESIYYKINGASRNGQATSMLMLRGQGCREFEHLGGNWYNFLKILLEIPTFKFTRLDLAIDLFTDEHNITMFNLREMLENFNYICNAHKVRVDYELDKTTKTFTKQVLIIGTQDSETQLEIYNKKLEKEAKEFDVPFNTWIRFEIRFRENKSNIVVTKIIEKKEPLNIVALGLLKKYIRFVEPNQNDMNKSRWELWKPWENFLKDIEEIEVKNQKRIESSIKTKRDWLERSVGLAQAQSYFAYDDLTILHLESNLNMYLKLKKEKMTKQKLQSVNYERESKGLSPLVKADVEERFNELRNTFFEESGKLKKEMYKIAVDEDGEIKKGLEELFINN